MGGQGSGRHSLLPDPVEARRAKQVLRENLDEFVLLLLDEDGLTKYQRAYLDEIGRTGNINDAYRKVYPNASSLTAHEVNQYARSVLKSKRMKVALRRMFSRNGINTEYVRCSAKDYIEKGKKDARWAAPGVQALTRLAQILGMLKDNGDSGNVTISYEFLNIHDNTVNQSEAITGDSSRAVRMEQDAESAVRPVAYSAESDRVGEGDPKREYTHS